MNSYLRIPLVALIALDLSIISISGMTEKAAKKFQKDFLNCRDVPVDLGFPGDDFIFDHIIGPYLHCLLEVIQTPPLVDMFNMH